MAVTVKQSDVPSAPCGYGPGSGVQGVGVLLPGQSTYLALGQEVIVGHLECLLRRDLQTSSQPNNSSFLRVPMS